MKKYLKLLGAGCVLALAVGEVPAQSSRLDDQTRLEFWNNPEFVKRFMASYGANPDIEPRFENPEEQLQFRQLGEVMRDNPSDAIAQLQQLATPEANAVFPFTLGALYMQEGEPEQAVVQFRAALAKFPDFRRAHRNLGIALAQMQRYDEATASLTKALNLGAADVGIYGLLGFAYLNSDRILSAEAAYLNALLRDPENQDWKLGLIKCYLARSQFSQAVALLDELLQDSPDSASLWSSQANVFLELEDYRRAITNLEMLRRLEKATLANLMLLGDVYLQDERLELALPVYLEAIEKDGVNDVARSLRAIEILVSRGVWAESRHLLDRLRELHEEKLSGEEEAKYWRLESEVALANGEGKKALEILEQIIAKNPLDGDALLLAGEVYSQEGENAKAIVRFELAAKLSGFQTDAWLKHAQLLVRERKYSEALKLLERAQKAEPRDNVQQYYEAIKRVAQASSS